jgi:hypothetical protein
VAETANCLERLHPPMAPQALQTNTLDDLICRLRPFRQQKGALVLKTELIQRVADVNPHLRASDAEKITPSLKR